MYFYYEESYWKTTATTNLYPSNYNKEIDKQGIFKSHELFKGFSLWEDIKVKL